MTKAETAKLLALITAFDRRTTGEADVEAWHLVLNDLDPTDCAEAVRRHYTTSRDWLMPADIRASVGRIRRDRLAAAGDPPPDADPDDPASYLQALRAGRHALASPDRHPRPIAQLTVGKQPPRPDYADAARKARQLDRQMTRDETDPTVVAQHLAEARAKASRPPATPTGATSEGPDVEPINPRPTSRKDTR